MLILKIINKLKLLNHFNLLGQISLNGVVFKIPVIKKLGIENIYMSEPWMISLLSKMNLKDGQFIDVGVNIGQTLLKLKSVNKEIEYIGFEPNPTCIFYSNELIEANQFKNTVIIPTGLADKNGILKLNFYSENISDSSASIIENFRPDQKVKSSQFISVNTVDNISDSVNLKNVKAIKIDVEGAEMEVMDSLKNLIKKNQSIVLIEILPVYTSENTFRLERQQKIEAILIELDYLIYRVIKKNNKFISIEQIESIGIHKDLNACDYVFIPRLKKIEGLN